MESHVAEAGGIVVRFDDGTPRVLLTSARANAAHWIFPKGHIREGETPEAAAVREVWEETGVAATVERHLGTLHFTHQGQTIRVDVYMLRFVSSGGEGEGRRLRWCTYDEALSLLSFEEVKELLRASWAVIQSAAKEE